MKRFTLLFLCAILLTGCGKETTIEESASAVTETKTPPPTKVAEEMPTAAPTPITTPELQQVQDPDRDRSEGVSGERSGEDKSKWTSAVHFTEAEDKYFTLTYNDEKFCFDRETDKIYGDDVITNIGDFAGGNQEFSLACYMLKESTAWEWAQTHPEAGYEYVASYPRESGSIEVYWWQDFSYQIYYELNDFDQGGLYFRYGVLKEELERSSFKDLDELIACIGEVTVTQGKFAYELPHLETYEVIDVHPFDMYVSPRRVFVFDRPNTANAYSVGMLNRNDIVTVTGDDVNSTMLRVLADGKEVYIDEMFLTNEYVEHAADIRNETWEKYKAEIKPKQKDEPGYKRGDEMYFSSSVQLPYSKFEVPVWNQFNSVGLLNEDRIGLFGYTYPNTGIYKWSTPPPGEETSKNVESNFMLYIETLDALPWVWEDVEMYSESSQGFLAGGLYIHWYTGSFGEPTAVELTRPLEGEDYYTLTIRYPLDVEMGESLGFTMSENTVKTAREALITVLCCVSSTPMELYNSLLYNLYYVPDGEETMDADWMVVGDSQIRVSFEESSQPRHIWTFHIKEK